MEKLEHLPHEEIARLVISQEVMRKIKPGRVPCLQDWQRVRHGYTANRPNCFMIQDLGGWGARILGEKKDKGSAIWAESLPRTAMWNCDKKT